jgi:acetylornithine deacetylase/succinyl-diaminopimelate desuccinylase-like protein
VPAYAIPADHPAVRAATSALRTVYPDRETLLVRIGGTLPAASLFEQILGLKTLLFSFSTADEQLHAPNEFFRLSRLDEGLRAWAELWRLLGSLDGTPLHLE